MEMRNAEMRRILSQDPNITKALAKMEEDQKKVAAEWDSVKENHTENTQKLDHSSEAIENSRQDHKATTES